LETDNHDDSIREGFEFDTIKMTETPFEAFGFLLMDAEAKAVTSSGVGPFIRWFPADAHYLA
jgi:hypothetical protein